MHKLKRTALLCIGILCFTITSCTAPSSTPEKETHIAPLPPIAPPSGITRTSGINMLTGLPETAQQRGKRPIAIMIDNVQAALPQRGISEADIIYEIVTESGITRLMALFSDYEALPAVGPVRSARDQHVKLMLPLHATFLHIGSSTYASELLDTYKYKPYSINGLYQPGALKLDSERARKTSIDHCWFTSGEVFSLAAKEYNLNLTDTGLYSAFKFASKRRVLLGEPAGQISVRFSSYVTSTFTYNPQVEKYFKGQFGKPHIDENNGEQLSFDNVFILFTDIEKYPDGVLSNVRYAHGGVGYYFSKGRAEQVRWAKPADNTPILILSADGTEQHVEINSGKSYLSMVDLSLYEHFKIMPEPPQSASSLSDSALIPESAAR